MAVTFWTNEEVVEMIKRGNAREILSFRVEAGKVGVNVMKLPSQNEAFGRFQVVYQELNIKYGRGYEAEWKMAKDLREIYELLLSQFNEWWVENVDE